MFLKLTLWGYGLQSPLKTPGSISYEVSLKYDTTEQIICNHCLLDCEFDCWVIDVITRSEGAVTADYYKWKIVEEIAACIVGQGVEEASNRSFPHTTIATGSEANLNHPEK